MKKKQEQKSLALCFIQQMVSFYEVTRKHQYVSQVLYF